MRLKYLLMPGTIKSQTDGELHSISYSQLTRLYKVLFSSCMVYTPRTVKPEIYARLIKLYPREDGNYEDFDL